MIWIFPCWCQWDQQWSWQIPQWAYLFSRFLKLGCFFIPKLTFVADQVRKTTLATSCLAALLHEDFLSSCWRLWLYLVTRSLTLCFTSAPLFPPSHHLFSPLQALRPSNFLPEHLLYSPACLCPLSVSASVITVPSDSERVQDITVEVHYWV